MSLGLCVGVCDCMTVDVVDSCMRLKQAIRSAIKTSVAFSWRFISTYYAACLKYSLCIFVE